MHRAVGSGVEGINIGLIDPGAGQADLGTGAEGDHGIGCGGKAEMGFHRPDVYG